MLIILTILLGLAIIIVVSRMAWTYHRDQLSAAQARTLAAQQAAGLLADHIEHAAEVRDSAIYARDFYRAALNDIITVTDETDTAGQIARRFVNYANTPRDTA